nr:MAG TPA: Single strand binding protein [Caudoviricetes sp.]
MNKVILMGRLTRAPEVRYSDGADPLAVARYTLAVNRRMKKNGEQDADFIPCVAFGKTGEFAEKYFKKGQLVAITGRLQVRSWDKDGERRWTTEVIVEEQYFAESKAAAEQNRPAAAQSKPAAQTGKQMGLAEQEGFYPIEESVEDDDLPF